MRAIKTSPGIYLSLLVWLATGLAATAQPSADPIDASTQILLVTTKSWDAVQGKLRRFSRHDSHSHWQEVGSGFPIVVGRSGLGWGKGVNALPPHARPQEIKAEGDGKSPAGIFRLRSAFGIDPPEAAKPCKLPYQQITNGIECVDDAHSTSYNQIVNRNTSGHPDWNSSEKMLEVGENYRLGVVVEHNVSVTPGAGSCIFLHVWTDAHTGTSGCTAMPREKMKALLGWLDIARDPLLVQLPETEYQKLKKDWKLP